MMGQGIPARATIERAVEALINLLDELDGDPDAEPEHDISADDLGETPGQAFVDLRLVPTSTTHPRPVS
jgi:hypothetical protein